MSRMYKIDFNQYTNLATRDCVKKSDGVVTDYRKIPASVIIREEDIMEAMKYGDGINNMSYVGDLVKFGKSINEFNPQEKNHRTKEVIINGVAIDIDEECVDMIKIFNRCNLKTTFCCRGDLGNNYYVMFSDVVTDKQIEEFIAPYISKHNHCLLSGRFLKWCRIMNGKAIYNWLYEATTIESANYDLSLFLNHLGKVE